MMNRYSRAPASGSRNDAPAYRAPGSGSGSRNDASAYRASGSGSRNNDKYARILNPQETECRS